MDQKQNIKLIDKSVLKAETDLDMTADVLETPQLDKFKHENNVFAQSFKQSTSELLRTNSYMPNEIETPAIINDIITNQVENMNSLGSSSAGSSSSSLSSSSLPQAQVVGSNELDQSLKSAPKKSFLNRSTSQTGGVENQKHEMNKQAIILANIDKQPISYEQDQKYFNIPLIEQLSAASKMDFTTIYNNNNSNNNINNNNNNSNVINKVENSNQPQNETNVGVGILNNMNGLINNNGSENSNGEILDMSSSGGIFSSNGAGLKQSAEVPQQPPKQKNSKMNTKTLNIAEKMKQLNKNPSLLESSLQDLNRTDSNMSATSSVSSNDDDESRITSSDQNQGKQKKRRLMEMNTEARKEQIRSSNREAARRCRERRRNYIELLENKIRNLETTIKDLSSENQTLKKFLNEHKSCDIALNQQSNSNLNNGSAMNNQTMNQMKPGPIYLTVQFPNNANEMTDNKNRMNPNDIGIYQSTTSTNSVRNNVINNNNLIDLNNISNMSINNPQIMQLLGETLIKQNK